MSRTVYIAHIYSQKCCLFQYRLWVLWTKMVGKPCIRMLHMFSCCCDVKSSGVISAGLVWLWLIGYNFPQRYWTSNRKWIQRCTWFLTEPCRKSRNCFLFPAMAGLWGITGFVKNASYVMTLWGDTFVKGQRNWQGCKLNQTIYVSFEEESNLLATLMYIALTYVNGGISSF